jgi:D-alanyl-D-alanine carboxypeptidase (penicillin-binding protein 5/6)
MISTARKLLLGGAYYMKREIPILIVLAFILSGAMAARASALPAAPDISARSCVLVHCGDGRMLYSKNADAKMLIASTTKIMTAIVVIENCPLDGKVEIKPEWCGAEGSSMYLKAGSEYTVRELLEGMMLVSGNDAAVALACRTAGSVDAFAKLMNEKAAALGMTDSSFKNPNGLDEKGHFSTARDMAKLAQYCMENADFRSVVALKSVKIGSLTFVNHNKLLWNCPGCIGVKTGYTMAAGRTLVSCCQRDGMRCVCVTLSDPDDWADHAALYAWAYKNYGYRTVIGRDMALSLPVVSGTETAVAIRPDREVKLFLSAEARVSYYVELPRFVFGGVESGAAAGRIRVLVDGKPAAEAELVYGETVPPGARETASSWTWLERLW